MIEQLSLNILMEEVGHFVLFFNNGIWIEFVQKFYGDSPHPHPPHIQENTDSLKPEVDDKASSVRIVT